MLSGHRSARRRRSNKSRAARIAVPLAIPMALGLTLGIIIAVSGGGKATTIQQSAMGSCASAAASAPAAAASAPAAVRAPRRRQPRPRRHPARRHPARRRPPPAPMLRPQPQLRPFLPNNRGEPGRRGGIERGGRGREPVQLQPGRGAGRGLDELHDIRAGQPAQRHGPGLAVDPRRRLHLGQRRDRGRVRGRHDPGAERPASGLRPAGDQPGHHAGRGAGGADDRGGFAGHPQRRVQRQRAGTGRPGRAPGQLHRRVRELADQPDAAVQRGQLLPDGQRRDRPRHADDPGRRHRQGRPGLPDHA